MGKFSTLLRATGLAVTVAMPAKAQDIDTVLATVNGTEITIGHLIALQQRLPEQYKQLEDDVPYNGMLDQLIQQTALSQEMTKETTKALDIGLENEMRAYLAGEQLARLGTAEIPEEDMQAAYDAQFADAEPEQEFNAAHILVETEEEALAVKKQVEDGADFADVAKEKSTGPSGPSGGALGWFGKGQMVPEFETAVLGLEDGQVSDPVQTQFGWHIVMRNESRNRAAPTLDEVRGELEQSLRAKAIEDGITSITEGAEVTRNEIEIDPSIIRNFDLLTGE